VWSRFPDPDHGPQVVRRRFDTGIVTIVGASVPIFAPDEVRYDRDHLEKTWSALGGPVTRADGLHLFFRWAWDLASALADVRCRISSEWARLEVARA
jgi:hypothetical protein